MKKLLLVTSLFFASQLCAAESAPVVPAETAGAENVYQGDLSLIQNTLNEGQANTGVAESLADVLKGLEQWTTQQEVKDAILMTVENMQKRNVSDEEIIKFVKIMMSKKAGKNHTKLMVFTGAVLVVALSVCGYLAWKLYVMPKLNNRLEAESERKGDPATYHTVTELKNYLTALARHVNGKLCTVGLALPLECAQVLFALGANVCSQGEGFSLAQRPFSETDSGGLTKVDVVLNL